MCFLNALKWTYCIYVNIKPTLQCTHTELQRQTRLILIGQHHPCNRADQSESVWHVFAALDREERRQREFQISRPMDGLAGSLTGAKYSSVQRGREGSGLRPPLQIFCKGELTFLTYHFKHSDIKRSKQANGDHQPTPKSSQYYWIATPTGQPLWAKVYLSTFLCREMATHHCAVLLFRMSF